MDAKQITCRFLIVGIVGLLSTGCIPTLPLRHLSYDAPPQGFQPRLGFTEAVEPQESTTLQELLALAVKHHPDLQAAHARVEVARGKMIQAGLYPNPSFGPNMAQLGDSAGRLGEAGVRLTQTFVTNGKLRIAKDAGARAVEAADWQAMTRWHDVVTRVRLSYFEFLIARREQETLNGIVGFSEKAYQIFKDQEKFGAGFRPDLLRAKVEFEQNRLKREISERRVEAARQNLFTALGRPPIALDLLKIPSNELAKAPPIYDWETMLTCLRESSTELHEARSLIAQQERLLAKAKADVCPNVTLSAIPFYASAAREMRAEIILQAQVPIFDRNQGNIHAAKADLVQTMAFEQQLELRLTERLTNAHLRYQSARRQVESYHKTIVPEATESLKLIDAGYRGGGDKKYDYTAVLQAQQVLFQTQLAQTQALGELWRSVVEIAGILQQEDLQSGCAVKERRY